jgi:hypothetical protein
MPRNGSPLLLALVALAPACSSGLDFNGLSGDFGKPCTTGVGPDCKDVASGLSGLRVELPCMGEAMPSYTCVSAAESVKRATLGGAPGTTYNLQLQFRGIVELNNYGQGVITDYPFQAGGTDSAGAYNTYALEVTDPPQTYFLNAVASATDRHAWSDPVNVTETVPAKAMATVTLRGDANDGQTIKNINAGNSPNPTPTGVDISPNPFSGQFMQVDVLSVAVSP